ncbi:hypothetical protein PanWU01x14_100370 [Parasponia andersonii]|uniref:Uncharacterized protein n=1 Tax=Parasponia andersonii TaxID=3476 RepID=A0A2P5D3J3_PARAD|nr:hypothetical protein PanWU01x14_100370 [Parasponia andersonii]
MRNPKTTHFEVQINERVSNKKVPFTPIFSHQPMNFPALLFSDKASASLKGRGEGILIRVGCVWQNQLGIKVT